MFLYVNFQTTSSRSIVVSHQLFCYLNNCNIFVIFFFFFNRSNNHSNNQQVMPVFLCFHRYLKTNKSQKVYSIKSMAQLDKIYYRKICCGIIIRPIDYMEKEWKIFDRSSTFDNETIVNSTLFGLTRTSFKVFGIVQCWSFCFPSPKQHFTEKRTHKPQRPRPRPLTFKKLLNISHEHCISFILNFDLCHTQQSEHHFQFCVG